MKQPLIHERMPFNWPHKWDPYKRRDYVMWMFDQKLCDRLLSFDGWIEGEYDCWAYGCLDAPDEIPLGGTARIMTVGGFEREEYLTLGREWESWAVHERAQAETAEMIKGIMKEWDE